jgi:hypothetical protein
MTEFNRLYNFRSDPTIVEIKPKVFLVGYLKISSGSNDEVISIKEIVDRWGYSQFFDEMIERFCRLIKNDPDEDIVVHYDIGGLEKEMSRQKLLGWSIYNNRTDKFGLVGGVLFQEGEMSFHT